MENEDEYVPAMEPTPRNSSELIIPEEFQRVTGYMTQVRSFIIEDIDTFRWSRQ